MINVNKITSTLAKLGDPELQQYAQMHKNDPYIMALAMSESNRRKELRAASQESMQEQPKVVDQMVAEMAPQQMPEDQGIGQLPAGDMNFAGGGIIAFADGGDVERYQSAGLTRPQFIQDIMALPQAFDELKERAREEDALRAEADKRMAQKRQEMLDARSKTSFGNYLFGSPQREAEGVAEYKKATSPEALAPVKAEPTKVTPTYSPEDYSGMDRRIMTGSSLPNIPSINPPPKAKVDDKAPPAPAAPGAIKLPSISDLTALRQQISDKQDFKDPAAAGLLELEARERAAAAADKQAIERDAARFKDAYKGREARLAEREADIGKQKESNTGLALLNAGLAIMSTPGGLATAIGKGAQVGTAQFSAGLDKIRSAQERLGDARDRLDDLKLNREESTAKEIRAAENNYRRVSIDAQKRTIDGIRMAADVNEKRATDIYSKTVDMTKTLYEQQQANARTQMQVGAPGATERLVDRMARDSKFAAEYKNFASIGPDVKGSSVILAQYAGPKGEMALRMLETTPEGRIEAQLIRQQLKAAMLKPQTVADALP
jgi:hypothetical protein